MSIYVFDTETADAPWAKENFIVQFASVAVNDEGEIFETTNVNFKLPEGKKITEGTIKIHGITNEAIQDCKMINEQHLEGILYHLTNAKRIIGHNIEFDIKRVEEEYYRYKAEMPQTDFVAIRKKAVCTMKLSRNFCKLPMKNRAGYKSPKLQELHKILFGKNFEDAHDALADVTATWNCCKKLVEKDIIKI